MIIFLYLAYNEMPCRTFNPKDNAIKLNFLVLQGLLKVKRKAGGDA